MGTLYIISTPIGNLEDITLRALKVLKEVDLILCEDTRNTKKLLDHFKIKKPLKSYFEHTEVFKTPEIIRLLETGKSIALVSDSGTPTISDPGYRLIKEVYDNGIKAVPVPGASAVVTALSASGLPTDRFIFVGFLPQKEGKRKNFLSTLKNCGATVVAFESPRRLVFSLGDILEVFGDVDICVAREVTKVHEEFLRAPVSLVLEKIKKTNVKGEVTLVINLRKTRGNIKKRADSW